MDIKKVKEIFDAQSSSVYEMLSGNGIAYQIPDYQRQYSWKKDNIIRLMEDVAFGINTLSQDQDAISFLGSIIVVSIKKTGDMPNSPLSIVDGQQRLSTIVLLLLVLHNKIRDFYLSLDRDMEHEALLYNEANKCLRRIHQCLYEDAGLNQDVYDLYPIITRDIDLWGNDEFTISYLSPIPALLHEYALHLNKNSSDSFTFDVSPDCDGIELLKERLEIISSKLDDMLYPSSEDSTPLINIDVLINDENVRRELLIEGDRFANITEGRTENDINMWNDCLSKNEEMLRLCALSTYLLQRVAVTKVEAKEKYAFDVFEALNTTGEPLTALETFKPKLINFINNLHDNKKAYSRSNAKVHFDEIEAYLASIGEDKKQAETQDLVVSFALYIKGDKILQHLSVQRKYLRDRFSSVDSEEKANNFVLGIRNITEYKNKFFKKPSIEDQLKGVAERELALTCLEFLRQAKKSLSVPIMSRYFYHATEIGNIEVFVQAVKAITAFTVLWRISHPNTNGIDSVYRELMSFGYRRKKKISDLGEISSPICFGLDPVNAIPDIAKLQLMLRNHLRAKDIGDFDSWFIKVKSMNVYNLPGPIAKMALLMSHHLTTSDDNGVLSKDGRPKHNDYLSLETWHSQRAESIEHVAPKNPDSGDTWDNGIYETSYLVNTLGNLTLLPKIENSIIGNKSWEEKKQFFDCFCKTSHSELDRTIESAESSGVILLTQKVKEKIKNGQYLGIVESIPKLDSWDKETIERRTDNLSTLLWEEAQSWLTNN